ncbi:MAG: cytochrome d ubiquinol oxidase subunit II [Candidatus Micrarchaeota archaeon]|nr:cytochrome d ubiquinol oxidase subunit II [Candidatus Micrarchaeota archaeon]
MNLLYSVNYLIFSVFLTLLMLEIGLALVSLAGSERYKDRIAKIINPIWEVTGTFAIFYVVNFEVSYPLVLGIVGTAYAVPLLVAAIFLIIRNVLLALRDYVGYGKQWPRIVYPMSTIVAGALAISVLSSGVSGMGINLANGAINASFIFNPFNLLIILSIILLSFSLANGIIKVDRFHKAGMISEILGFAIAAIASYVYLPGFLKGQQTSTLLIIVSLIVLIAAIALQAIKAKYAGPFNAVFVALLINLFGASIYPYVFGTANIMNYAASNALASPELLITTIGGTMVALSLIVLIYVNYVKK